MFSQTKFLSFIKVAMQTSSREKKINKNFQYLASHVSLQFLQIVLKNIEQKVSGARLGSGWFWRLLHYKYLWYLDIPKSVP